MTPLLGLDAAGLDRFFADLGEKPFRARQVSRWLHQRFADDPAAMTDLARATRERLSGAVSIAAPPVIRDTTAADGTRKWLFDVGAGNAVESVYIPEGIRIGSPEDDEPIEFADASGTSARRSRSAGPSPNASVRYRGTLCISSQAGCALDCAFCSTGKQGFNRNLTTAEIVGQLWHANRTLLADGIQAPWVEQGRMIDRLAADVPVALAVSLHAADDALRDRLVPINRRHPLKELIAACLRYLPHAPRDFVTFEYVMLDGVNDRPEDARRLVAIAREVPSKLNLIPFNPFPGAEFSVSPRERIRAFQQTLMDAGVTTTIRKTRGDDIDAACGQLAGQVQDRIKRRLATRIAVAPAQ